MAKRRGNGERSIGSELLGLCWNSINLEQGYLTVQRQLIPLKDGLSLEENTKSRSGRRSVTLTLDLYTHVTTEMQQLAAKSLNGLFSKEKGPAKAQGE